MKKKILVTSALPYVNNVPHLGTMVCIISADVYTRFLRLNPEIEAISVLGTDEHGTTTETIAMNMDMTPQEAVDYFFKIHKEIYDWFNCDFDCFGRTTSPENKEITQDIFKKLKANNYITEKEMEQFYDKEAQKYLSDRFIEGTCPHCKYKEARGDQCENCGKLLNPTDLINPKSKLSGTKPIIKKTKHLFIKLNELQPKLEKFVEQRQEKWSENALTTTNAWLKEGLKERAITRDLKWGIPVPEKGYENKVFYVWFDAPIGYIAITKANKKNWKDWWHNPENVRLVQFMGKDNTPFHTILFPASLIGTQDNYTLLDTISVNEYMNYENLKFSKSRGIGVFGDNAKETGIPADAWRYYLMINRPETADTKFMWKDFQEKINHELVGNLGNLINRTTTFIKKFCDYEIKEIKDPLNYNDEVGEIIKAYENIEIKKALKQIMNLSKRGNQYFQENEPWKLINEDPKKAQNVLAVLINLIKDLSILLQPIIPKTAQKIKKQLNADYKFELDSLNKKIENHKIGEPETIFNKLQDKETQNFQEKYSGKQINSQNTEHKIQNTKNHSTDNSSIISTIDLRVAKITSVEKHPEADRLYIEKIDCGNEEERTIVSGLVSHYEAKELIGKNIILVYNLKPAKLRGIESKGMLLAVSQGKKVGLLEVPEGKPGDKVTFKNIKMNPKKEINIEEFFKVKMIAEQNKIHAENYELQTKKPIKIDKNLLGKIG
ncbi:methionine--tRNA ligase [Candidatus Woesearchaeota archaeon]|nr:methionine--tRNA ligase [Candidatus Woesearchaeota archaeon]